jgi:hypothetical protein
VFVVRVEVEWSVVGSWLCVAARSERGRQPFLGSNGSEGSERCSVSAWVWTWRGWGEVASRAAGRAGSSGGLWSGGGEAVGRSGVCGSCSAEQVECSVLRGG